jgi:nucleobase transporter 1/2
MWKHFKIQLDLENFQVSQESDKTKEAGNKRTNYGIDDNPSWYLSIFMALQHYLTMIGAIVSIPFILTPALCMKVKLLYIG